jgi:transposase
MGEAPWHGEDGQVSRTRINGEGSIEERIGKTVLTQELAAKGWRRGRDACPGRKYRRAATRYEKTAINFLGFVLLASIRTWLA